MPLRRAPGAVLAVLVLAGCGGGPGTPTTLPTLTPTTTPTATATPANDLAAITATGRQWFRLLQSATTIETAVAMEAITTPTCKCRRASTSVRDAVRNHETYFGTISINALTATRDGPTLAEIVTTYDQGAGGLRRHDGGLVSSVPGHRDVIALLRLVFSGHQWLIARIETLSPGSVR
jgi:hypothetical protein